MCYRGPSHRVLARLQNTVEAGAFTRAARVAGTQRAVCCHGPALPLGADFSSSLLLNHFLAPQTREEHLSPPSKPPVCEEQRLPAAELTVWHLGGRLAGTGKTLCPPGLVFLGPSV